jgi:hypothetical protein
MIDAPGTPSTAPDGEISAEEAFALVLETACEDFENLQDLVSGQFKIDVKDHRDVRATRAGARIQMALAKSFVFNAHRANRICQKNKADLPLDRVDRKLFLSATKPMAAVRDVNEHGFDGDGSTKPSMHQQEGGGAGDETSLNTAGGPKKILMGPLNLYTAYLAVERIRKIAGFQRNNGKTKAVAAAGKT